MSGSMLSAVGCVVTRDLMIVMRNKSDAANTLLFFAIVVSLFPFHWG